MGFDVETRIRNVTAVLGPTNTGKTHLAIERMLGHETGMIGLPLRLLAREVYDRIAARVGVDRVALITGEEKIRPEGARFWVSTVEAMPREIEVDFLAIDEIQLAADPERGHVFTDRLLHARGKLETLLLGAQTMRECITDLVPGCNFITRPRLSKLTYSGQKKITRLPGRTAVVAFSSSDVYKIAELIRRQQGGAAVVMGALSPRTRNAQVALYQSGDVDYLVATDAIGMGLNLDVNHVAFASTRKFDGYNFRQLLPAELAQIAGRAGRHLSDGTFGVTGDVEPFDQDVVDRLESHNFDSIKMLQWRARNLDFSSLHNLRESLRQMPREQRLVRARMADDVEALETVSADRDVTIYVGGPADVALLWDVCQIPDYRKISSQSHAELVSTVFKYLKGPEERIPEDWLAKQIELSDRTDGDIDTLATRIAHIRTWTFVSNRSAWLKDPAHWQGRTREIEDSLSDALHEQLTQRFVDRRTSALMKGMRAKEELSADIGDDGAIHVESHFVGRLKGFRFIPDTSGQNEGIHGKAARHAAAQVLAKELAMRVRRVTSAKNDAFKLTRNGRLIWRDQEIARLEASDDGLKPQLVVISDEHLAAVDRDKVHERLQTWLTETIADRLQPLAEIAKAEDIQGLARGIAFRLVEGFGTLKRDAVSEELRTLDQPSRAQLRKYGVRFGAFNIFFPQLMKPGPAELALTLWTLKHASASGLDLENLPEPPRPGLTSVPADPQIPEAYYRARGYHVCGPRAVRMDILERLADMIRPLIAWRGDNAGATPPRGSTGDGAFVVVPEMLSILGCSGDELGLVLKSLGFWNERRPKRPKPTPQVAKAAAEPAETASPTSEPATAEPVSPEPAMAAASPADASAGTEADADADADADAGAPVAIEVAAEPADGTEVASAQPVEAPPPAEAQPAEDTSPAPADATSALEAAAVDAPEQPAGEPELAAEAPAPAVAVAATTAAEADGPEMEEIWRPRRHRREERQGRGQRQEQRPRHDRGRDPRRGDRPNRGPRPDQPAAQGEATQATAEGQSPQPPPESQSEGGAGLRGDRRPDRDRHGGRPWQGRGKPQGQGHRQGQGSGQGQNPGQGQSAGQAQGHRQGQGPAQGPGQGRDRDRHGGPRDNRNRDNRDRPPAGQPRAYAGPGGAGKGGKPQRQTVDPDSPFAKLSALKLELEKRSQEPSSS